MGRCGQLGHVSPTLAPDPPGPWQHSDRPSLHPWQWPPSLPPQEMQFLPPFLPVHSSCALGGSGRQSPGSEHQNGDIRPSPSPSHHPPPSPPGGSYASHSITSLVFSLNSFLPRGALLPNLGEGCGRSLKKGIASHLFSAFFSPCSYPSAQGPTAPRRPLLRPYLPCFHPALLYSLVFD